MHRHLIQRAWYGGITTTTGIWISPAGIMVITGFTATMMAITLFQSGSANLMKVPLGCLGVTMTMTVIWTWLAQTLEIRPIVFTETMGMKHLAQSGTVLRQILPQVLPGAITTM